MKNIIITGCITYLLIACQITSKEVTEESSIDSLITNWENNWNNHDSTAIKNMYDNDVVFFDGNIVARNKEELITKMIRPYFNAMKNMKHETVQKWITQDKVGSSGLWTVDMVVSDTMVVQLKGAFTYIWKTSNKGEWKVITTHIHDFSD